MLIDIFLVVGLIVIAALPVIGYIIVRFGFEQGGQHCPGEDQPY